MSEKADKIIKKHLAEDEKILWRGRPVPHVLWDGMILHTLRGFIAAGILFFAFWKIPAGFLLLVLLVLFPIIFFVLFDMTIPWRQKWNLSRTYYVLTDKRAIKMEDFILFHRFFASPLDECFRMLIETEPQNEKDSYSISFNPVPCFSSISFQSTCKDGYVRMCIYVEFLFLRSADFFALTACLPQKYLFEEKKVNGKWELCPWKKPEDCNISSRNTGDETC